MTTTEQETPETPKPAEAATPDPTPYARMDLSDLSLGGSSFGMPTPIAQDLQTRQAHIYDAVCGMQRHLNGAEGIPGFLGTVQLLSTILISRQALNDMEEQLPDIVERSDRLTQLRTSLRDRLEELKELTKAIKMGTDEIGHLIFAINKLFGATMKAGDAENARRERDSARRRKEEGGDFGDEDDKEVEAEKPAKKARKPKAAAVVDPKPAPLAYDDPTRPRLFSDTAPTGALPGDEVAPVADPRQTTIADVLVKAPPALSASLLEDDLPELPPFDPSLSAELDHAEAARERAPSSETIGEFLEDEDHEGEDLDHAVDPASEGMVGDDGIDEPAKHESGAVSPFDDMDEEDEVLPPLGDEGYNKDLNPDIVMPGSQGMVLVPRRDFNKANDDRRSILFGGFKPEDLKPEHVKHFVWKIVWEGRTSQAGTQYAVALVTYETAATIQRVLHAMGLPYELRTTDGKKPANLFRRSGRPPGLPVIPPSGDEAPAAPAAAPAPDTVSATSTPETT